MARANKINRAFNFGACVKAITDKISWCLLTESDETYEI